METARVVLKDDVLCWIGTSVYRMMTVMMTCSCPMESVAELFDPVTL